MKIDHITINAIHIDESLQFYREVFCLKPLPSVDMGDHYLYYFELDEDRKLELISYQNPAEPIHPDVKTPGIYRHFALKTDDIDGFYQHCLAQGVKNISAPVFVPQLDFKGMLLFDPNGVEIEVLQRNMD